MTRINRFDGVALTFAVLVVFVGLMFIWLGGQISHLSCTRAWDNRVDCRLQRRFLGIIPTGGQILPQVTGSEVKEDCFDGCRYWVEIVSGGQAVRLTQFSSYNQQGVQLDQQRIGRFLAGSRENSLELTGKPSWTLLLSSVPLIVIGGLLAMKFGQQILSEM